MNTVTLICPISLWLGEYQLSESRNLTMADIKLISDALGHYKDLYALSLEDGERAECLHTIFLRALHTLDFLENEDMKGDVE